MLNFKHENMCVLLLYITLFCAILICGATTFTVERTNARNAKGSTTILSNTCGSMFTCKSGQCIDRHRFCDGTKDCADASDETYEICRTIACPRFSYRCAYGACVDGDAQCNGVVECADGSDELVGICGAVVASNVPSTNASPIPVDGRCPLPPQPRNGKYTLMESSDFRIITYTCAANYQLYPTNYKNVICQESRWVPGHPICISLNSTYNRDQDGIVNGAQCRSVDSNGRRSQFTCSNGQCIESHLLCDGTKDCTDGSDETLGSCAGIPCRKYSFRCTYGACIDSAAKCNGIVDCADDSDESRQTCDPSRLAASENCTLPSQPNNGCYTVKNHKGSIILTYSCAPNHKVHPTYNKLAICLDGEWWPGLAACIKSCSPLLSQSVDMYCDLDGVKQNCSEALLDGTTMRMRCKHPYVQAGGLLNPVSTCRNSTWDGEFIKCVPDYQTLNYKYPACFVLYSGNYLVNKKKMKWKSDTSAHKMKDETVMSKEIQEKQNLVKDKIKQENSL